MMILRFKTGEDKENLLHKAKKMAKYSDMIVDILEDCLEEEDDDENTEYRQRKYRHEYDKDEKTQNRYRYRGR